MFHTIRIIFAGTSSFSAYHLDTLIQFKYKVVGILTKPDQPSGRGNQIVYNPVKKLAKKHNLPIYQPYTLNTYESQKWILNLQADIIIVVSYGLIFPDTILNIPRFGCINVHGSLLPRWRGAAPIQRALLAGDTNTGVTIIQMNSNLDAGDILYSSICEICPNDTSASLYNRLMYLGSRALLIVLEKIISGRIKVKLQNHTNITYAKKIKKTEAKINWYLSSIYLTRCIRAFNPFPGSYISYLGKNIKIWEAYAIDIKEISLRIPGTIIDINKNGIYVVTGQGALILTKLQFEGKKVISIQDLLNSQKKYFFPGNLLS